MTFGNPAIRKLITLDLNNVRNYIGELTQKKTIVANSNFITNAKNTCKTAWEVIKKESGEVQKHVNIPVSPNILNVYFINVPISVLYQINNSDNVSYIEFLNNFKLPEYINYQNFKCKAVDAGTVKSIVLRLSSYKKKSNIFGFSNYVLNNIISSIILPSTHLMC